MLPVYIHDINEYFFQHRIFTNNTVKIIHQCPDIIAVPNIIFHQKLIVVLLNVLDIENNSFWCVFIVLFYYRQFAFRLSEYHHSA